MIEVEGLRKEYGDLVAVDGIDLRAEGGRIFGLLGPNGAGKSTTIGCISGLLRAGSGSIRVMGHDVREEPVAAKSRLGVVPQELALYEDLSARENLRFWGAVQGLTGSALSRRVEEVLALVELQDRGKERAGRLSGGMKRRLNFACGVIHDPPVLLLDEPTAGVDPQSRVKLLDLVRDRAAAGCCVLYTTHYMEEAQALCDELAIIDHGRLIAGGSLDELRALLGERDVVRLSGSFDPVAVGAALSHEEGIELVQVDAASLIAALPESAAALPRLFGVLGECGAEIREATLSRPSLESLFIKLTGKQLRD